ncbi:hypothetical protein [Haliangium ochraceum]|uniref:Lipoprotein n=1 Tax=Haliangium ochraceum (strain DSM 14365 / JCM 11303 / SMP-2) TaxID=502025 RepID=D0LK70_HALO1|nr:hypothetical protein [Haliangium ochraceum]ACY13104.1 hypothetical protein Hoch_0463 [Haliangium ochraceum DSM 14365]
MKYAVLLLPLLSFAVACGPPDNGPLRNRYRLDWHCVSPDGCERSEELQRIDRAYSTDYEWEFASTVDDSFEEYAMRILTDSLGSGCAWLYDLTLLGYNLQRSRQCYTVAGFELELSIPNEDPATFSEWVVVGRDIDVLGEE